jgi:hypothetical protein
VCSSPIRGGNKENYNFDQSFNKSAIHDQKNTTVLELMTFMMNRINLMEKKEQDLNSELEKYKKTCKAASKEL